tara:strand:+ start:421 stop:780 length:360 start_codon:yes stop_codon:yes gene_type:complete
MSLIKKVIKLAQDLDNKGLRNEADTLDKFAEMLQHSEPLSKSELSLTKEVESLDWMDPEAYMEMFNELFKHNNEVEGMDPIAASSAAIRTMNSLAMDISEQSSEVSEEERDEAKKLFNS